MEKSNIGGLFIWKRFIKKIYIQEGEILALKEKSIKDEAKIDSLHMLLASHKELIHKISELVNIKND